MPHISVWNLGTHEKSAPLRLKEALNVAFRASNPLATFEPQDVFVDVVTASNGIHEVRPVRIYVESLAKKRHWTKTALAKLQRDLAAACRGIYGHQAVVVVIRPLHDPLDHVLPLPYRTE